MAKTIKFWQEMLKALSINPNDKFLIGKNDSGEAQYCDANQLANYLNLEKAGYIPYTNNPVVSVAYTFVGAGTYGSINVATNKFAVLGLRNGVWNKDNEFDLFVPLDDSVISAIEQAKAEAVSQSNVATQQALAALSIGGRNYFLNSKDERSYTNTSPLGVATFELNTEYTISFDAKIINGSPLFHVEFNGGIKAKDFTLTNDYVRYSHTLSTNNVYGTLYFWLLTDGEVSLKNIKVEKGNKATDWTPAPEDLQDQVLAVEQAAKDYTVTQDALKQIETKAYADNKITDAEARAIADATTKANAAKAYADAQDLFLKSQVNAYADGKVTAEEQARINQANANLQAAKDYAAAQDNFSKIETKAYADNVVDAEEARAIADAQAKLNEAKTHADAQAAQASVNAIVASQQALAALSVGGRNYILNSNRYNGLGIITGEPSMPLSEQPEPNQQYTLSFWAKRTVGEEDGWTSVQMVGYWEDSDLNVRIRVDAENNDWNFYSQTFTAKPGANIQSIWVYSELGHSFEGRNFKLEKGNKATDWTPAPEDVQQAIIAAQQSAAADATAKANAAREAAIVNANSKIGDLPAGQTLTGVIDGVAYIKSDLINVDLITVKRIMMRGASGKIVMTEGVLNIGATSDPTNNLSIFPIYGKRTYYENSQRIESYVGTVRGFSYTNNGTQFTINGWATIAFKDEDNSPLAMVLDAMLASAGIQAIVQGSTQYFQISGQRMISSTLSSGATDAQLIDLLFTQSSGQYIPRTEWCGLYKKATYMLDLGLSADNTAVWKRVNTAQGVSFVTLNNGTTPIQAGWYYRLGEIMYGQSTLVDDFQMIFNLSIQLNYIGSDGKISQTRNLTINQIKWFQGSSGSNTCSTQTPQITIE